MPTSKQTARETVATLLEDIACGKAKLPGHEKLQDLNGRVLELNEIADDSLNRGDVITFDGGRGQAKVLGIEYGIHNKGNYHFVITYNS